DDDALTLSLKRLAACLSHHGKLIVRAVVPPKNNSYSWLWKFEALKGKLSGIPVWFRPIETITAMIIQAGFQIEFSGLSGGNEESVWFVGSIQKKADPGQPHGS
ncbi:MAG TPA: hypothetical protein VLP30_05225, partial [Desulfatirhabdiaceae bacterium]|nr:hypothetical protein [Desulfatirhabdiaceae bacterium]